MALFLPQNGTKAQINALPIVDGQLLWTTDQTENEIYYDDGLSRVTLKGGYSSYTPTASNLGTITTHTAIRKGGIGRYKLNALSGTWTSGTTYTICTLNVPYRPTVLVRKDIVIRSSDSTYIATLIINIGGTVTITPRSAMSGIEFWIDETYIL